jgi:hypothetical protein
MSTNCTHLNQIQDVTPSANGCEECLAMGDRWVHLRECLICGGIVKLNCLKNNQPLSAWKNSAFSSK